MLQTNRQPKWIGWKVPGDLMTFWWPANTVLDTYDTDHARAMDMAIKRHLELYGEAPNGEIAGKLVMATDVEVYG